jgi:Methyltransferase domain
VLISEQYRKEQEALHAKGNYGTASLQFGEVVSTLVNRLSALSVLDYGCGSMQNLRNVLRPDHEVSYEGYDPAVEEFSGEPDPADLVCCIDVLEHIEPELLDNVLDHLQRLSPKWAFMTVHTGPARKTLSDGRNAHLIQQPPCWWLPKFFSRWDVRQFQATPQGFTLLCRSLPIQTFRTQ